jgi:hypothetical protein
VTNLRLAEAWLARHGLVDTRPTPALAARLAVRQRATVVDAVMLAGLIIAVALTRAYGLFPDVPSRTPLVMLAALMGAMVVGRWWIDRWVRRVDHRAGAGLTRRAAHTVPPGWRAVVGVPHMAFAGVTVGGALALALGALAVDEPEVRYAGVALLIGLVGGAAAIAVRIRHLLTRPVVAEDSESLTADVVMRIEDARETTSPTALWSLPVVILFGTAPVWWNVASMALVLGGLVALIAIQARTPRAAAAARQAMAARW